MPRGHFPRYFLSLVLEGESRGVVLRGFGRDFVERFVCDIVADNLLWNNKNVHYYHIKGEMSDLFISYLSAIY